MKYAIAQLSHVGRRPSNQDRLGHWRTREAVLLVVADGMGGHAHGEYAAEFVLRYAAAAFRLAAGPRLDAPGRFLRSVALGAHGALLREAESLGLADTPRTTLVACVVQEGRAHWTHVGDSRLYLLRNGGVLARTVDHTLVQQLVDEGRLMPEEARGHPQRNRLLQCLGGVRAPQVGKLGEAPLEPNDVLLLCSDGLWEPLYERQIVSGLDAPELSEGLARLARLALEWAGRDSDNISALALAWQQPGIAAAGEAVPAEIGDDPITPDPDILRGMFEDPDSDLARMRVALRGGDMHR